MSPHNLALFVHFAGLIALFGAFAIFVRGGSRLRASRTIEQLQVATDLLRSARPMFPAGWTLLLLSGLAMGGMRWHSAQPFIIVGLIVLIAMPLVAARLVGRHLDAISAAMRGQRGPILDPLAQLIAVPRPWTVMTSFNGALFGVVFVMTTKPGWLISAAVVIVGAALGAVISSRLIAREASPAAPARSPALSP